MLTRKVATISVILLFSMQGAFASQDQNLSPEDKEFLEQARKDIEVCKKNTLDEKEEREPLPGKLTRVDCRILKEGSEIKNKNTLIPHKQNYILFYANEDNPNLDTWIGYEGEPENEEVIFQISFKYPLWVEKIPKPGRFAAFIGFTQKSFWQLYNKRNSSPFRETNYEPELMINYLPEWKIWGFELPVVTLGINHQSNGQSEPKSRSWNRVYLETILAKGDFAISIRPWYRLQESESDDDNRHILDYMGRGDIVIAYSDADYHASVLLRNNLQFDKDKENRGAVQVDFGFPLPINILKRFKFYVQAFHGYGESLIDYNYSSTRIGVGILTTNWL